jgi:hypothetical protein
MSELDSRKTWRNRKLVSAIVGLGSWVGSDVLWHHYEFTRPATRQPEAGRVYPLNTHGTYVYLTFDERALLYFLMLLGVACFLLTAAFYYFERRDAQRRGD